MKKIAHIILTIAFLLPLAVSGQPTVDKKAKAILDAVSAKTKTYTSMQIDFSYTMENKKDNINESQDGNITLKGEKYYLSIAKQEIICDGKTVWTYLKEVNEVQINAPSEEADALNPSTIFTIWEKGFKYKFIKEEPLDGATAQIIDLIPVEGKPYHRVRLYVDKVKSQLMMVSIHYKDNSSYTYKIKKFTPNATVADTMFTFDKTKHPGVEVIDMR
ncbi:MAG: outer membrane lipoprotein carrier protein LolA [Bacteroidetes bacterium]|nr:outer membrane lipoprotein carrier protein LolA [Bacteroidota bacterium]MBU1718915.1 outer membrane lipoprotein carrier protein LolA [Bacteroidota bacterium]